MIRILLFGNLHAVRHVLQMQIEFEVDLKVVGDAEAEPEMIGKVAELQPDVVVVDADFAEAKGIELAKDVHTTTPSIPLIILSMEDTPAARLQASEAGAVALVPKQTNTIHLIEAIRQAAGM